MGKILISAFVLITSSALIVLKLGTKSGAPVQYINGQILFNINILTVIGIGLYGLSFLLYTYLLSAYDLGYIIPLTTGLVYTIIFIASFFIFKESFTVIKIIGIVLIMTGLVLLNVKR